MVNPISLTHLHGTNVRDLRPVKFGTQPGVTMTDAYTDGVVIDSAQLGMTTVVIYNSGANSLDFKIYGHLDENNGTQPTFDGTWVEIPKDDSEVTLATDKATGDRIIEDWAWLLIRFKRTTAGQDTTADVTVRSRQSRF